MRPSGLEDPSEFRIVKMSEGISQFDWRNAVRFWWRSLLSGLWWAVFGNGIWGCLGLLKESRDRLPVSKVAHYLPELRAAKDWIIVGLLSLIVAFAKGAYQVYRSAGPIAPTEQPLPFVELKMERTPHYQDRGTVKLHISEATAYSIQVNPIGKADCIYEFYPIPDALPGDRDLPFAPTYPSSFGLNSLRSNLRVKHKDQSYPVVITYADRKERGTNFKSTGSLIITSDKNIKVTAFKREVVKRDPLHAPA